MPLDPEIFGGGATQTRDADIFIDSPKPTTNAVRSAVPQTFSDIYAAQMRRAPQALARGFLMGGPVGMGVAGAGEGLKNLGELAEHAGNALGGVVTDALASTGHSPEVAAGLGYGTNVATQAIPAIASGNAAKALAPVFQSGAKTLMQSALKPTMAALEKGDAARAIDTMLAEGIPVTKGGLQTLQEQIGKLNEQVKSYISGSNATVNKGAVGTRLMDTYNEFKSQVNPQADLEKIRQAWLKFRNHPDLAGKTEISVQQAQDLKKGTYRQLGDKPYGELSGAEQEAQKALARGLREEISTAIPQVGPINAQEGKLINAKDILERRVLMDPNKNMLGLTPLGANPLSWLLFMADRSPGLKSYLAQILNAGRERIPQTAAAAGAASLLMPPEDQRGPLYLPQGLLGP